MPFWKPFWKPFCIWNQDISIAFSGFFSTIYNWVLFYPLLERLKKTLILYTEVLIVLQEKSFIVELWWRLFCLVLFHSWMISALQRLPRIAAVNLSFTLASYVHDPQPGITGRIPGFGYLWKKLPVSIMSDRCKLEWIPKRQPFQYF